MFENHQKWSKLNFWILMIYFWDENSNIKKKDFVSSVSDFLLLLLLSRLYLLSILEEIGQFYIHFPISIINLG